MPRHRPITLSLDARLERFLDEVDELTGLIADLVPDSEVTDRAEAVSAALVELRREILAEQTRRAE